jgi:co-chaperonin GroES (HSP10)
MKPINNMVAIRPFPSDEIRLKTGEKLYLDIQFEEYLNARTAGEVVAVPEKLVYNTDPESFNSLDWLTDMELQVGDVIIYNYLAVKNAMHMKHFVDANTVCIPYDKIYVAIRNGEVIPINGNILVQPEDEWYETTMIVPDNAIDKSKQIGKVIYAGVPNRQYRSHAINFGIKSGDEPVKVGDRILFNWNDAIPIQPNAELRGEITRELLYRMQHKDVHAIVPEKEIIHA